MNRKSFDPEETPLPPHGAVPLAQANPPLPCGWCRTPTARATLNAYGARCFKCYEAFCRGEREGSVK